MEYYVIYDLNDNLIAYIDTKQELSTYTGLRIKDINYKTKNNLDNYVIVIVENKKYKLYTFV